MCRVLRRRSAATRWPVCAPVPPVIHAHCEDIRLWGREAADVYLAAWRPVLAERPDALWYPTLCVAPDHASCRAPRAALPGDRRCASASWTRLDQPRRARRGGPAGRHGLREWLCGDPRQLRAVRKARAGAVARDLRAGLPAHHAGLAPRREAAGRHDREALLRRRLRTVRAAAGCHFGLAPTPRRSTRTSSCWTASTYRGPCRSGAAICSPRRSRAARSSAAGICTSASRSTSIRHASRPTRSWCARRFRCATRWVDL